MKIRIQNGSSMGCFWQLNPSFGGVITLFRGCRFGGVDGQIAWPGFSHGGGQGSQFAGPGASEGCPGRRKCYETQVLKRLLDGVFLASQPPMLGVSTPRFEGVDFGPKGSDFPRRRRGCRRSGWSGSAMLVMERPGRPGICGAWAG